MSDSVGGKRKTASKASRTKKGGNMVGHIASLATPLGLLLAREGMKSLQKSRRRPMSGGYFSETAAGAEAAQHEEKEVAVSGGGRRIRYGQYQDQDQDQDQTTFGGFLQMLRKQQNERLQQDQDGDKKRRKKVKGGDGEGESGPFAPSGGRKRKGSNNAEGGRKK
jgi:hypothetical protein